MSPSFCGLPLTMLVVLVVSPLPAQTRRSGPSSRTQAIQTATTHPRESPNQPRNPVASVPRPFQLDPQSQALVDNVLRKWEETSGKIQTYSCSFERHEYDPVFLKGGATIASTISLGELRYAKPDKGKFRIHEIRRYDTEQGNWTRTNESGEHWVCDGKAIYEFNTLNKQLIVRQLPPDLQGQTISDGPLPFLFGAEVEKLKQRYSIRITYTDDKEYWLEARPRWQQDAANFNRVELILDRQRFLPSALQIHLPNGKNRTAYRFQLNRAKVNDPVQRFFTSFQQPITPLGWKKVVEKVPSAGPGRQARQPQEDGPDTRR